MAQEPEQIASKLKQINSEVKKQWGHLTNNELLKIKQKRSILVGKIQKRYEHRQRSTSATD